MTVRIKICGITSFDAALAAARAGAEYLGFVFAESSPRRISIDHALHIVGDLRNALGADGPRVVGVFNHDLGETNADHAEWIKHFDRVQHHGPASPDAVAALPKRTMFIPGFPFSTESLLQWDAISRVAWLVVDGSAGGEGRTFDHGALAEQMMFLTHRVMLAGGLTPENVDAAIELVKPWAVDVSSGVEDSPGVKSIAKIEAFCAAVRDAEMDE